MWSGLGAALVGGGLSVGGSLLGGLLNSEYAGEAADEAWARQLQAAKIAFERQKELMQLQMDYNTDMSNSAHQRQVLDMKLAGLNPILSSNLGGASYSGVSAPSVSTGNAPQASAVDFGDLGLGRAGDLIGKSSAMRLAGEQAKEIKANSISQRALNDANASSAKAKAELDRSQIALNDELKQTERAKQEELRTRSLDNEYTHLYKIVGRIRKWLDESYSRNSARSFSLEIENGKPKVTETTRGTVIPDSDWNRKNDPNWKTNNRYGAGGF